MEPAEPGSFPITSKPDNGLTCYLQLFSIRKQCNYGSLSRRSHAGPRGAKGTLRMFEPAPRNRQCLPANRSSSPWLGVINSIPYSFNDQKSTFFPDEWRCPLIQVRCHSDCATWEMSEHLYVLQPVLQYGGSHGRRGCSTLKSLAVLW